MKIDGSVFLVTGGASGLGAACVRHFAGRGGKAVIADVQDELGGTLAKELGDAVRFAHTDVTDEASVQAALAVAKELGPLRVVINCAGIIGVGRVLGKEGPYDLKSFSRTIQVNLIGTFNVIRLAAVAMAQEKPGAENERGVIINTASVAAFEGQLGQAAYSASKGGVVSMTLPIARELALWRSRHDDCAGRIRNGDDGGNAGRAAAGAGGAGAVSAAIGAGQRIRVSGPADRGKRDAQRHHDPARRRPAAEPEIGGAASLPGNCREIRVTEGHCWTSQQWHPAVGRQWRRNAVRAMWAGRI